MFKGPRQRAIRRLELIHADMMGPLRPVSYPGKNKYIITFTDNFSRYTEIYLIKGKDEAGDCLEKFLVSVRNLAGSNLKVRYIRCDRAKEYVGGKFKEIMRKKGIEHNLRPAYTPELNGTVERVNKTLQNKMRAILINSGLPRSMWGLAIEAASYV